MGGTSEISTIRKKDKDRAQVSNNKYNFATFIQFNYAYDKNCITIELKFNIFCILKIESGEDIIR
jgi:hypothetical protein